MIKKQEDSGNVEEPKGSLWGTIQGEKDRRRKRREKDLQKKKLFEEDDWEEGPRK